MIINDSRLNIIDAHNDLLIKSNEGLNIDWEDIRDKLDELIDKVLKDTAKSKALFPEGSEFIHKIMDYRNGEESFSDLQSFISDKYYEAFKTAKDFKETDIISAEFNEEGRRYITILFLENKDEFIHSVNNADGKIKNELIINHAILPSKADSYILIDTESLVVYFYDKKKIINDETRFIIPEIVLNCKKEMSVKESMNTIKSVTKKVVEDSHEASKILAKANLYLQEQAFNNEPINPKELAETIFDENDVYKEAFDNQIEKKALPNRIDVPKTYFKESVSQKIKTDTGIEITFPSEYTLKDEFISFINNPDGTISIEIKNIGRIINK